ncbi:hypothetical protein [Halomontanus rarus]|uniref:hypothetical protein n=1 Tax=Halomontanus rarus TaxID=3034020 RepID=UPI0023E8DC26|nr:hypothetical protein [Halovivax sp. TS33]
MTNSDTDPDDEDEQTQYGGTENDELVGAEGEGKTELTSDDDGEEDDEDEADES